MDFSDKYRFADWPDSDLPRVAAGVYAVWDDSRLLYCGMSGRQIERAIADRKDPYGLFTRLRSHASGRLSADQFCVYVANRLVIPSLVQEDLPRFATGELKLDQLTKAFIHEHLAYQYRVVDSSKAAYELESKARRGEVFGESPLLNPL